MSFPVPARIVGGPLINDVVLLSEDMSLTEVQEKIYLAFKPEIPQIWFDDFGGDMGKMAKLWVEWTSPNTSFPRVTVLTESNIVAVFKLLQLRRGVDVLCGDLPSPPQPEHEEVPEEREEEEEDEEEEEEEEEEKEEKEESDEDY